MKRVLIVDRDPAVRALVAATIDANRYLLFEAGTVRAGHEKLSECRPDVVILETELQSDWTCEAGPTRPVDPDRLERTPVVLLGDARASFSAPEPAWAGGTSIRAPFSPLELVCRLETAACESRETCG